MCLYAGVKVLFRVALGVLKLILGSKKQRLKYEGLVSSSCKTVLHLNSVLFVDFTPSIRGLEI